MADREVTRGRRRTAGPAHGEAHRRTQKDRVDESARRLTSAAVELINEKGYAQTTAKEIGLRAGYSRAMVAERFGSREALLEALLNDYESRIALASAGADASGFEKAMAPVEGLQQLVAEDPTFARAMFVVSFEAMHHTGELRGRIQQLLNRLRDAIADGIRAGQVDGSVIDIEPDDFSREALTSGVGYAYWSIMMPEQIDFPATVARWRQWVATSLSPDAGQLPTT